MLAFVIFLYQELTSEEIKWRQRIASSSNEKRNLIHRPSQNDILWLSSVTTIAKHCTSRPAFALRILGSPE